MTDQTWSDIRGAIERVIDSSAKRIDIETPDIKLSVYRVGESVRCDLRSVEQGGYLLKMGSQT